jgi:hypothetical protein
MDRQFCLDMAAAYGKSTTTMNKALAAAYRNLADRMYPVTPPTPPPLNPVTKSLITSP